METNPIINVNVQSNDTPSAQYKTVILKPNMVDDVNTLTQAMVNQANTKYVIKYDYTLGGDINIPANCVLEFDGGSIAASGNNDTITGNNTIYIGKQNIFKGILLQGTWLNTNIYDTIFDSSTYADSYNIIQSINAIINEDIYQEVVLTKDYLVKFSTVDPHYAFYVGSNTKFQVVGTLTAETTAWTHYRIITCLKEQSLGINTPIQAQKENLDTVYLLRVVKSHLSTI